MLDNDFDKYWKDSLESARLNWDKEDMWDEIEPRLPKKDRRPLILLIFFLIGLVGLLYVKFFTFDASTNVDLADQSKVKQVQAADLNNNPDNHLISDADMGLLSNSNTDKSDASASPQKSASANTDISSPGEESIKYQSIIKGKTKPFAPAAVSIARTEESDRQIGVELVYENSAVIDAYDSESSQKEISQTIGLVSNLTPLKSMQMNPHCLDCKSLHSEMLHLTPVSELKLDKKARITLLAINPSVSYGFAQRNLTRMNSELFEARAQSEKVLESISARLDLMFDLGKRFYLASGIDYGVINEHQVFTEVDEQVIQQQIDTASYYINYQGQLQYVSEQRDVVLRSEQFNSLYNKHSWVNVPISLGYMYSKGPFSSNVSIGLGFNVFESFSGSSINDELKLNRGGSIREGRDFIDSAQFGLSLNYRLFSRFHLSAGARYNLALSEYSIDGTLHQSYDILNMNLGLLIYL